MKSWVSDMGFEDTPMVPSPLVVPRHWGFNPTSPKPLPLYIYKEVASRYTIRTLHEKTQKG